MNQVSSAPMTIPISRQKKYHGILRPSPGRVAQLVVTSTEAAAEPFRPVYGRDRGRDDRPAGGYTFRP